MGNYESMALVTCWIWMVGCLLFWKSVFLFSPAESAVSPPFPSSRSLPLFLLSDCLSFFIQPCIHFDSALAADKCEMNTVSVHSLCSSLSLSCTLHLSLLCVFWRLDSEDLASWFSLSLFLSEEDIQNWVSFFKSICSFSPAQGDKLCVCVWIIGWNATVEAAREGLGGDFWIIGSRGQNVRGLTLAHSLLAEWNSEEKFIFLV